MSNEIIIPSSDQRIVQVRENVASLGDRISSMLGSSAAYQGFAEACILEVQKSAQLLQCRPTSLYGTILECARLGLVPGGISGEAFFVPFNGEATLVPGYKGLMRKVWEHPKVLGVAAQEVYGGDQFSYAIVDNRDVVNYTPGSYEDPGLPVQAFARLQIEGAAEPTVVVVSRADLRKVMDKGLNARRHNAWKSDPGPMARKTALIRLYRFAPQTPTLQRLTFLADMDESGSPEMLDSYRKEVEQSMEGVALPVQPSAEGGETINVQATESTEPEPQPRYAEDSTLTPEEFLQQQAETSEPELETEPQIQTADQAAETGNYTDPIADLF